MHILAGSADRSEDDDFRFASRAIHQDLDELRKYSQTDVGTALKRAVSPEPTEIWVRGI